MKGWRTLIINGLLLALPVELQYLQGIDWSQYVDPKTATYIVVAVNMILRAVTTTAVGKKD